MVFVRLGAEQSALEQWLGGLCSSGKEHLVPQGWEKMEWNVSQSVVSLASRKASWDSSTCRGAIVDPPLV